MTFFFESGKTTVATAVADRLNNQVQEDCAIVIPMDGWHIPKKELLENFDEENGMMRRGAPHTFDAKKMFIDLTTAKQNRCGSLPIYCREISDPVPNGVALKQSHRIVLVEGLYILWKDDEEWKKIHDLFDERWFVKCPTREEQIERLIQRSGRTWSPDKKERWGEWPEGARKRAEANDVRNMDLIEPCEKYADEVILSL
jgi:pantothenate kinase